MLKSYLFFLSLVFLAANVLASDTYETDAAHTNIGFMVKHMVIAKVKGKFNEFSVSFMYDEKKIENSSVEARIKTASVDTDNEKRDAHLKSTDFFDAEKYPEITFMSNNIQKKGDGFVAKGDLTIRGVKKEIELPFMITGMVKDPWGNTRLGIEADLTINRQDFGVSWNKTLDTGGLVVSDEVKIELNVEFVKK